jgi:hypothetical protein
MGCYEIKNFSPCLGGGGWGGGAKCVFPHVSMTCSNLSISISIVWQEECIATGTCMHGETDFPTFPLLMLCQIFHSFLLLADRWESRLVMGVANHSANLLQML